jgi:flagellar protein FliS
MNAQAQMQYQRATVETVSPGKLLLMLYDGAIRSLTQAQQAIADRDLETAHVKIIKAQDIIVELRTSLNRDYPIAANLDRLYEFYHSYLVQANLEKNSDMVETIKQFLQSLRESWQQAVEETEHPAHTTQPLMAGTVSAAPLEAKSLNFMG